MAPTKKSIKGFVIAYFLIFVINFSSYAQARIAIVGGINESTVSQTSTQPDFSNYKKGYSPRVGFHIGFLADFPLTPKSKFYFQPAIEFFNKGRKFAQTTKNGTGDTAVYQTNATQFINYIDVPLNLVYKFELAKKIALIFGFGPYVSFFYSGKTSSTTLGPNNYYSSTGTNTNLPNGNGPGQYATFDYGINALAGIDLGGSFITANFSRGLQNAYEDSTYSGTFKNQVFSITLGVYLNERKKKNTDNEKDTADQDHDGILDKVDFCPTIPGLKKYNGCPIPDSDCDSINDEEDKCPTVFGLRRYNGCPIPDTDGDSVNDEEDKCPTVKGLPQYKGCPIPIDETLAADSIRGDTMIYIIYYDPNKIRINVKGVDKLNKIRNLLKANETLNIKISGHSDKNSTAKIARKQSANRAIIVRNYLKNDDVPATRMKIYYWGSAKAVAPRSDSVDQWKNRRVEIAVYQNPVKINSLNAANTIADSTTGNAIAIKHKNKKVITGKNNHGVISNNSTDVTTNDIIDNNAVITSAAINNKKKHKNNSTDINIKNDQALTNSPPDTAAITSSHAEDEPNSTKLTIMVRNKNTFAVPNHPRVKNNSDTTLTDNSNKNENTVTNKNDQAITNSNIVAPTVTTAANNNTDDTANGTKLTIKVKSKDSFAVANNQRITNASTDTTKNFNNYAYKNVVVKNYDQIAGDTTNSADTSNGNVITKQPAPNNIAAANIDSANSNIKKPSVVQNNPAITDNNPVAITKNNIPENKNSSAKNNAAVTNNDLANDNTKNVAIQNDAAIKNPQKTNSNVTTTTPNNNEDDLANGTKLTIRVKNKSTFTIANNKRVNNNNNLSDAAANNNNSDKSKSNIAAKANGNVATTNSGADNATGVTTDINNKNAGAIKNSQQINNATVSDEQAEIDSATKDIDMGQTISQKPPEQINDTDKVLDCYTIYFDPNEAVLNSASFDILDHIREILRIDSSLYIGISGYSERIGSETSAQKISQERAYLARDYMNSYGVTLDRMRVSYWGSKIPVADDNDPYQQWENRRVEICIYVYPK
jgi:OmpA-OmpF porin, OOP family